jgi:hypothetical protein
MEVCLMSTGVEFLVSSEGTSRDTRRMVIGTAFPATEFILVAWMA